MTDTDREQWVDNDEGLYNLMRASGLSKRAFVRANRSMIDETIKQITSGKRPAHSLAYPNKRQ